MRGRLTAFRMGHGLLIVPSDDRSPQIPEHQSRVKTPASFQARILGIFMSNNVGGHPTTAVRDSRDARPATKLVTGFDQCLEKYPSISPGMSDPSISPGTSS